MYKNDVFIQGGESCRRAVPVGEFQQSGGPLGSCPSNETNSRELHVGVFEAMKVFEAMEVTAEDRIMDGVGVLKP